jgi:polysaccharide export outer membrane protein
MKRTFKVFLIVLFFPMLVFSQMQTGRQGFDLLEESPDRATQQTIIQPTGIALESTINPARYYVGPSDGIAVNIWTSPPLSFNLTVTPEGTLIIPTVGEVSVADITLAEAKKKVLAEIRKKYIAAGATVTLVRPRPIVVTVTGNVLNSGLYTLSAIDRADRALEEANKPTRLQTSGDVQRVLNEMSTRNVVLRHKDGTTSRVDIDKFLATKDDTWNPYLREGDIVIVPAKNIRKNVIGIYGEVNVPGRYEYVRGDSVKDALRIAQGFTRLAIRDSVEFSRLSVDGNQLSKQLIDGAKVLKGEEPDIALEPGDRIVVRTRVDLREDYRVTITGEVRYPGTYPITKERTHLSEAIKSAGGFTQFADLKSAEVYRRSTTPGQLAIEQILSARGGVPPEDSLYYSIETNLRLEKEIVSVDFERLFIQKDTTQDIILQSEDFVSIPSLKKTVYVFGQVVSPGHVPFSPRERVSYYVQKAGGFTDRARTGDVKIIKARTKQWLDPDETTIDDGDYVWVPKEIERPFIYYSTIISHMATILSAVVGIAVVVATVGK